MTYNVDVVSIGWNLRRSDTGELDITDASIERRNGNRRGVSIVSCGLVGTEIENDLYRGSSSKMTLAGGLEDFFPCLSRREGTHYLRTIFVNDTTVRGSSNAKAIDTLSHNTTHNEFGTPKVNRKRLFVSIVAATTVKRHSGILSRHEHGKRFSIRSHLHSAETTVCFGH